MAATIQQILKPTRARGLDTSTGEQIVGNQLLADPSFDTDVAAGGTNPGTWKCEDSHLEITGGKAVWSAYTGTGNRRLVDNVAAGPFTDVTARYRIRIEVSDYTQGALRVVSGSYSSGFIIDSAGTHIIDMSPAVGAGNVHIEASKDTDSQGDAVIKVSEITIYKLENRPNANHAKIKSGRALEFDGVTDYLSIADSPAIKPTENVTIACWVKLDNTPGWSTLWGLKSGFTGGIWLATNYQGELRCELDGVVGHANFAAGTSQLMNEDMWYRVVMTYDSSSGGVLYQNGVAVATTSETGSITQPAGEMRIGDTDQNYQLEGKMSDFQLWNSTWTAADVEYDYVNPEQLALNRGGTSLTNSNLKLWYPMNEGHRGDQSYVLDASNIRLSDNLLTNGDFATGDFTGWLTSGDVTINNGGVRIRSTDGTNAYINGQGLLKMGSTYKLTYDVIAINSTTNKLQHEGGTTSVTLDGTVIGSELGTYTYYFNNNRSNGNFVIKRGGSGADVTIDNLILQEVNPKNNATTVFYGDEMITNDRNQLFDEAGQWSGYNGPATAEIDGGKFKVVTDGDGTTQGAQLLVANLTTPVVGRTYRITAKLDDTGASAHPSARYKFMFGGNDALVTASDGSPNNGGIDTTEQEYYADVVADDAAGDLIVKVTSSSNDEATTFTIDDVSVKEIGVASGWTDADQQLDIPQTALQSYNQIAYNEIYNAGNAPITTGAYTPNFGTSNFCISFAIFPTDLSNDMRFMAIRQGGGRLIFKLLGSSNNEIQIYLEDADGNTLGGAYQTVSMTDVITEGNWYHILLSVNRSNDSARMYINGVYQEIAYDISGLTGNINGGGNFEIYSFSGDTDCFVGVIDEIAIWKGTAFSEATAQELYNDGKVLDPRNHSLSSTLINYWKNEGLTLWQDKVGTAHVATNRMTETMLITAGVDSSRDSQGFLMNRQRETNCLNFPFIDYANNGDVNAANFVTVEGTIGTERYESPWRSPGYDVTGFSFECWFKAEMKSKPMFLVSHQEQGNPPEITANNAEGFHIRWSGANTIYAVISDNTNRADAQVSGSLFTNVPKWYHIVVSWDHINKKKYVYIDGILRQVETESSMGVISPNADIEIGSRRGETGQGWVGQIDDVKLYNRILTDGGVTTGQSDSNGLSISAKGEVLRNYNAGKRSHR